MKIGLKQCEMGRRLGNYVPQRKTSLPSYPFSSSIWRVDHCPCATRSSTAEIPQFGLFSFHSQDTQCRWKTRPSGHIQQWDLERLVIGNLGLCNDGNRRCDLARMLVIYMFCVLYLSLYDALLVITQLTVRTSEAIRPSECLPTLLPLKRFLFDVRQ